jgi:hypothetical protein
MKIVQTFWAARAGDMREFKCGWWSTAHHYYSWILSAGQARKAYGNVHLVADSRAADVLRRVIGIPFDSVDTSLDGYGGPAGLWSAAKVRTYSLQKEPFIHVDADVFLWKKLPDFAESAPVLGQAIEHVRNVDYDTTYRRPMAFALANGLTKPPSCWSRNCYNAVNCGVFGGHDLAAIGHYCGVVDRLMSENAAFWGGMGLPVLERMNFLVEQYTAFAAVEEAGAELVTLFDSVHDAESRAREIGYTHVMKEKGIEPRYFNNGEPDNFNARIQKRAKQFYPEQCERLEEWLKS